MHKRGLTLLPLSDDVNQFVETVRQLIPDLLDESGAVLYSTARTLRKGELYILGLNPGGQDGPTIRERLNTLPHRKKNEYLDVVWSTPKPGEHPLQRRLKWLMDQLGYDLKDICASNLIFTRSRTAAGIKYRELAEKCWPVHETILDIVKPTSILTFGVSALSPFQYILSKFPPEPAGTIDTQCSGHSNWKCKSFNAIIQGRDTLVIGVPHLSRYNVEGKSDVLRWVRYLMRVA